MSMAHVVCSSTLIVPGASVICMQLCWSRVQLGQHQHRALVLQGWQCVLQLQVAPVNHGCQCMCLHAALVPREHARRKRPGQRHLQVCGCVTHTSNCMHQFCSTATGRQQSWPDLPVLTALTAVDIVHCVLLHILCHWRCLSGRVVRQL